MTSSIDRDIVFRIEQLVDAVLICIERMVFVDLELCSWIHEVIPLEGRGVLAYRVVSYGYAKRGRKLLGFSAVTYVSGLSIDDLAPVETRFILTDGYSRDFRPEVEFEKCLRELVSET